MGNVRNLSSHISIKETPQSKPVIGKSQVKNSAGGLVFSVTAWDLLNRFLILGSEGGSYYASERKLTENNAQNVIACIKEDGLRVVNTIVEISDAGRAPKNDPALMALALCISHGSDEVKNAAAKALPKVARISTHLFHFAEFVKNQRGWGRLLKRSVADWYNTKTVDQVAFQMVKFRQRDGWSHGDMLRLGHPNPKKGIGEDETARGKLYKWATSKEGDDLGHVHPLVDAFERAKTANPETLVNLIHDYQLPWEAIPTDMVNNLKVSEALLAHMPLGATLRNLSRFTANGLIKPLSASAKLVVERLSDAEAIERSRIHPVNALNALKTYHQGHGIKGSLVWTPVNTVSDALEEMFYATFKTVQPSGKATMLALDVSGSMEWDYCAGSVLSPREASAVMAMVTARCEESYQFMAFSQGFTPLPITATDSLNQVIQKMKGIPFNGTDCSVPMTWALEHKIPVETFVVYTDNETWAGKIHPFQALKNFRDKMGIPAKLIVVGMVSNGFTIADPSDAGMLDVVGFDSNAPALIADFAADRF